MPIVYPEVINSFWQVIYAAKGRTVGNGVARLKGKNLWALSDDRKNVWRSVY